jgi:hypothetical protein
MLIRRSVSVAAIAAIGVLALGSSSASASTALRTDPSGGLLSGSTTIRNLTSHQTTLQSGAGAVSCAQTFLDADVNANSSATSITGKLTTLTVTSCTDNILAVNILDCTLATGSIPTVTVTANDEGGAITLDDPIVRCATSAPGKACYYTASTPTAVGRAVNTTKSVTFSAVSVTSLTSGFTDAIVPANCGGSGTLSATLTQAVQGTGTNTVTITTS